jgi:hypothetical protein
MLIHTLIPTRVAFNIYKKVRFFWQKFKLEKIFRGNWLQWSRFNSTGWNPIRWCSVYECWCQTVQILLHLRFFVSVAETVFMISYCREICNANIHRCVLNMQIDTSHSSRNQWRMTCKLKRNFLDADLNGVVCWLSAACSWL